MISFSNLSPVLMFVGDGLSLYEVWKSLSWLSLVLVIVPLFGMVVFLVAIGIERYLTYGKASASSIAYRNQVKKMLESGQHDDAINAGAKYPDSHLAAVITAGLKEKKASGKIDSIERAFERAIAVKTADLKRGLAGLATVGSTAPFVGLFGTVVGIINAFVALKSSGAAAGLEVVGGAIAEALITTAFGIVVAVPAVWLFNFFTSKVTAFGIEMENVASEMIDYLGK